MAGEQAMTLGELRQAVAALDDLPSETPVRFMGRGRKVRDVVMVRWSDWVGAVTVFDHNPQAQY